MGTGLCRSSNDLLAIRQSQVDISAAAELGAEEQVYLVLQQKAQLCLVVKATRYGVHGR